MTDKNGIELHEEDFVVYYQDGIEKIGKITRIDKTRQTLDGYGYIVMNRTVYYPSIAVSLSFRKATDEEIIYWNLSHQMIGK
jgi:hypothetical protein